MKSAGFFQSSKDLPDNMGKPKNSRKGSEKGEAGDDPACHSQVNPNNVQKAVTRIKSQGNKGKKVSRVFLQIERSTM